jgi:transcriptional regulator with XRE-family HTH domain
LSDDAHTGTIEVQEPPRRKRRNKSQRDAEAVLVFDRRCAGYSTYEIAKELGVSVGTVENRIEEARSLVLSPGAETFRDMSQRTLETARRKLLTDWGLLQTSADPANPAGRGKIEHSPKFAEALVKIEDRLAKLQGADRPVLIQMDVKLEHTGSIDDELTKLATELGLNDTSPATAEASLGDEGALDGSNTTADA